MKQNSLVQVSAYYPPHLGGQENVVQDLATQLAATGHSVQVLTSAQGGGQPGISIEQGVTVQRLRAFEFGHAAIMPSFAQALYRATNQNSIVHVHIGQAFTPEMVWLISRLRRFRYIAELHIDFEPSGPAGVLLPLYKRLVLGPVLRGAAAVIVLNEATLRTVRQYYGYQGEALIMSNGIDEAYFAVNRQQQGAKPPETLRLLFVGRLSKQKNLPVLLRALKRIQRSVQLDIIGEGSERAVLEQTIASLGLTNVTLHGRLPRFDVLQFYETHDALVLPSLNEAQPLVLLEAMAARIPIIGTNVVGVMDHIRDCGIVCEPTPDGLATAIERLHTEYHTLAHLARQGYTKAAKLRWSTLLREYETLYDRARA